MKDILSKSVIKIDQYVSRNNVYHLREVYYDYVKVLIYQYDQSKNVYKVIKPKRNHFIIWDKQAIFLSVMKLDDIALNMLNDNHLKELQLSNPNALIVRPSIFK